MIEAYCVPHVLLVESPTTLMNREVPSTVIEPARFFRVVTLGPGDGGPHGAVTVHVCPASSVAALPVVAVKARLPHAEKVSSFHVAVRIPPLSLTVTDPGPPVVEEWPVPTLPMHELKTPVGK